MIKKQNEILQFLSKYKSCTVNQLIFFTKCSMEDIKYMINSNYIVKDEKTGLLRHKLKQLDIRTAIALDVIKDIQNNIKDCVYSKNFPVILTVITNENTTCDIAVVRHIEQETVFTKIEKYSKADKIIVVLENEEYDRTMVNTRKEVLICTYPIKIIDKIN
jgi:hypothetical protein